MQRFCTTRWSLVIGAGGASPDPAGALDALCRIYRPPVLAFVRRRGYTGADAEDIAQAFFEQLLRLRTYASADPERGRFRVFLQVALKRFLCNHAVAARAAKRGGQQVAVSLDAHADTLQLAAADEGPDAAFERDWAHALLHEAMMRLRDEAEAAGKLPLFTALEPFLFQPPDAEEYAAVAARLGMRRNTLAVAIHRLRQRLRERVHAELAETVSDPAALANEIGVLQASLGPTLVGPGAAV
jgi:RNA polymerase sigma factor (sigma-70 family)